MGLQSSASPCRRLIATALLLTCSAAAQADSGSLSIYYANQAHRAAMNCLDRVAEDCLSVLSRYVDTSAPLLSAEHQPMTGQMLRLRVTQRKMLTVAAALRDQAIDTRELEPQQRALALEQVAARIDTLMGTGPSAPEALRPTPAAEVTVQVVELISPSALETSPMVKEEDAMQAQAPVAPPAFPPAGIVPAETLSQAAKLTP